MARFSRIFKIEQGAARRLAWGDVVILTVIAVFLYSGILLAKHASGIGAEAPPISLSPVELPVYAYLSIRRMALAYVLSLLFTLVYGYQAARSRRAERILIPILDVLQSVPILSFLPVVLLGLSAVLPQGLATELASIVLIFTSQVWNMTFSWYQSLITIPKELREAAACSAESVAALQDAGAAVRGHRPHLEQHDELGRRVVLPDGGRDLHGGRARLPAAGARGLPAGGGESRGHGGDPVGDRHPGPHHRGPGPTRVAAAPGLVGPVQAGDGGRGHGSRPPGSRMHCSARAS